jgi:amino acid adenylation domain-containing protein
MYREIGMDILKDAQKVITNGKVAGHLSEREHQSLIVDYNTTEAPYPKDKTIVELFKDQVVRSPDEEAIRMDGKSLTYRQLDKRSNQIAAHLRSLGVGVERLVVLCMEHSIETVCAILGVLKAGGAYVPVDPFIPAERLSSILRDISDGLDNALPIVLTQTGLVSALPSDIARVVTLDPDFASINGEADCPVDCAASPNNIAYVIYTSGSTGKPKGVMVEHRSLVNYIWWANGNYCHGERLTWPLFSSLAFDLTVTSIFTPLISGGRIVVYRVDAGVHGGAVFKVVEDNAVDIIKLTPSHLVMIKEMNLYATKIRKFIVGGEDFKTELARDITRIIPHPVEIYNEYGPTEATVGCMIHCFDVEQDLSPSVPIGVPAANTGIYILDQDLNPVPIGVVGEMYLAGDGLARGYFNRAELTTERFLTIQDPRQYRPNEKVAESKAKSLRVYKTGDLARWNTEGRMEYLGRTDHQVKIGGIRIELGEIESSLLRHPDIRECVVDVFNSAVQRREFDSSKGKDQDGEEGVNQLVGYYVSKRTLTTAELHGYLAKELPDYMLPQHFIRLDRLPLTSNGKVDRNALPAPSPENTEEPADNYIRPETETEKALSLIWTELLKVESIGINDDFFSLGGHSLQAIRIRSRIRDVFGMDIPLQTIFEKTTIAGLAEALSDAKTSSGTIRRREGTEPTVLSFSQEQLWFLYQMAPRSPVYNIVDFVPLHGKCDSDAVKKSLKQLTVRHEILRTYFSQDGEKPLQVLLSAVEPEMPEEDLSSLSNEQKESEWLRFVHLDGREPFDLSRAPLFRVRLVHFSSYEHRLLLTIHHIVADEWSTELIQQEVKRLYEAFLQGSPSPLSELPIQYADFACWQRNWLQGEALEKQIAYWKDQLSGAPTVLELPADKPRPAVQSFQGAGESFELSRKLVDALKSLGRQEQATLFMVLLAGFTALLHRYTGQEDILVGTPITGRTRSETENLIGMFLNTVLVRSQLANRMNFRALLRQVRDRALGAYAHPELPFGHLVAELAPERDASRTPLFQVMFILHNPEGISQVSQVSGNRDLGTGTSKFDLTLSVQETDEGLSGIFEYATDLFDRSTIERMAGHWRALLEAIVASPERWLSELPLLTDPERNQLLVDFNRTSSDYPRNALMQELFETQAGRTPGRVAVKVGKTALTYAELNARANRMAQALRVRGVGRGQRVGLCVERGADMLAAVLGILKAGAAYVPLDPSFPVERLRFMAEDAQLALLVSTSALADPFGLPRERQVLLDADAAALAAQSDQRLTPDTALDARPQDPAYVIYTSGSTGQPKGVVVPHRAVVNFLSSMAGEPGLGPDDVLLAVTTLSFDIAVLELQLPLAIGGTVVIASREEAIDGRALKGLLEEYGVSIMQATPVTWRLLLASGWKGGEGFKALIGGEGLPKDLADQLIASGVELWNMYGPTETTVWSTCARITDTTNGITIGKPIANTTVYVLDAQKNLCPIGVPGELCIGGDGVTLGYWNRPELTTDRFIPDLFSTTPGATLYRTGDRARWRNDGTLEHLGRMDFQVKLRGYRIEVGEVETAIARHPAIREAVVMVREDVPGDPRLVAYFVTENPPNDLVEQLRAQLRATLPDYMIPAHFVTIGSLPLTANGKIDRKALPAPERVDRHGDDGFVAPRNDLELCLAAAYEKVLGIQGIGIDDNFFELGGNSLSVIRLIFELEQTTGIKLDLAEVFVSPTIRALSAAVHTSAESKFSAVLPLQPEGDGVPIFCLSGLEIYREFALSLGTAQPVYGVYVAEEQEIAMQAHAGATELDISIERLTEAYKDAIRKFRPTGPYRLAGLSFGGVLAVEVASQLRKSGAEVDLVILLDTILPQGVRRNWSKWALAQLVAVTRGDAINRIRSISGKLRRRIPGSESRVNGTRSEETDADEAYQLRQMALFNAIRKWDSGDLLTDFNVVLFQGTDRSNWGSFTSFEDDYGWRRLLQGPLQVESVAGDHLSMVKSPNVQVLGEKAMKYMVRSH